MGRLAVGSRCLLSKLIAVVQLILPGKDEGDLFFPHHVVCKSAKILNSYVWR